jgi:hypothetical protein
MKGALGAGPSQPVASGLAQTAHEGHEGTLIEIISRSQNFPEKGFSSKVLKQLLIIFPSRLFVFFVDDLFWHPL